MKTLLLLAAFAAPLPTLSAQPPAVAFDTTDPFVAMAAGSVQSACATL